MFFKGVVAKVIILGFAIVPTCLHLIFNIEVLLEIVITSIVSSYYVRRQK